MDYDEYTDEQLIERIIELEMLNKELLKEKEQENRLDFAWYGNLGHWYWNLVTNSVVFNKLKVTTLGYTMDEVPKKVNYQFFTEKLHPDDFGSGYSALNMLKDSIVDVVKINFSKKPQVQTGVKR